MLQGLGILISPSSAISYAPPFSTATTRYGASQFASNFPVAFKASVCLNTQSPTAKLLRRTFLSYALFVRALCVPIRFRAFYRLSYTRSNSAFKL